VVYGDLLIVDENENEMSRQFMTHPSKFIQRHWSLFARNQSTFFSRDVFETVGYPDEDFEFAMDADLFWRILESDLKLVHIPEFLGAFRIQQNAKTSGDIDIEHMREIDRLYDSPIYEKMVPERSLELLAMFIKAIYLLRDQRWAAFKYNGRTLFRRLQSVM
jgi:GT2 family glycosyltransferase